MRRSGLTLLELIIVLTILAVLVGVATVATEGVVEQSREDASRRTLDGVRDALVGPADVESGTAGYIAHTGLLPESIDELLMSTAPGWRGPYLRLAPGETTVRDGRGRRILARRAGDTVVVHYEGDDDTALRTVVRSDYAGSVTFHIREVVNGLERDPVLEGDDIVEWRVFRSGHPEPAFEPIGTPYTHPLTNVKMGTMIAQAQVRAPNDLTGAIKKKGVMYHTVGPRTDAIKKLILR